MVGQSSSRTLYDRASYVQDTPPANPTEGDTWTDTSGNNVEFNQLRNGVWELITASGPDTPEYPVGGALWRDTTNSQLKNHDGTTWQPAGVDDHSQLTGVTAAQHHTRPAAGAGITEDANNNLDVDNRIVTGSTGTVNIASASVVSFPRQATGPAQVHYYAATADGFISVSNANGHSSQDGAGDNWNLYNNDSSNATDVQYKEVWVA